MSNFPVIVKLAASVTMAIALPGSACAQIYGDVRPNGAVVLTNIPGEMNESGLKVIVGKPSDAATRNAIATPLVTLDEDGVKTSQFADILAEAARKWNVRAELLRAIIAVESGFNPLAVSKRGARGLMQLMPETAKRFAVSNLFDPRANVLAGAQYLRALLDLFNDNVELAVAAYNAGERSVIKAGYRIPAIPETKAYVPAVMARYRRLISG